MGCYPSWIGGMVGGMIGGMRVGEMALHNSTRDGVTREGDGVAWCASATNARAPRNERKPNGDRV